MDAHEPVTLEEGDRYPLRPPILEATPPGYFLARALGHATVASPFMESTVTDTLRDLSAGVTAVIDHVADNHSFSDRLRSMGFQSGQSIRVLRRTPHVLHVRVGSTEWAIRDRDAKLVKIIPENPSKVHGRDC